MFATRDPASNTQAASGFTCGSSNSTCDAEGGTLNGQIGSEGVAAKGSDAIFIGALAVGVALLFFCSMVALLLLFLVVRRRRMREFGPSPTASKTRDSIMPIVPTGAESFASDIALRNPDQEPGGLPLLPSEWKPREMIGVLTPPAESSPVYQDNVIEKEVSEISARAPIAHLPSSCDLHLCIDGKNQDSDPSGHVAGTLVPPPDSLVDSQSSARRYPAELCKKDIQVVELPRDLRSISEPPSTASCGGTNRALPSSNDSDDASGASVVTSGIVLLDDSGRSQGAETAILRVHPAIISVQARRDATAARTGVGIRRTRGLRASWGLQAAWAAAEGRGSADVRVGPLGLRPGPMLVECGPDIEGSDVRMSDRPPAISTPIDSDADGLGAEPSNSLPLPAPSSGRRTGHALNTHLSLDVEVVAALSETAELLTRRREALLRLEMHALLRRREEVLLEQHRHRVVAAHEAAAFSALHSPRITHDSGAQLSATYWPQAGQRAAPPTLTPPPSRAHRSQWTGQPRSDARGAVHSRMGAASNALRRAVSLPPRSLLWEAPAGQGYA